jgi:DUF3060 family protein
MNRLLAALSLCLATAAFAGDLIQIDDNNENQTLRCEGNPVIVNGNQNNLTLAGDCPSVVVNGNQNQLAIEAVGKLRVPGNNNQVTWARALTGKKPTISSPGSHNTIAQSRAGGAAAATAADATDAAHASTDAAAAAMAAAGLGGVAASGDTSSGSGGSVSIRMDHLTKTFACANGRAVNIQGGNNELTFTGSCGAVNITGGHNVIHLESAEAINVMGAFDTVTYKNGSPAVNIVGKNSTATREK